MKKICFIGEVLIDFTPAGVSANNNILFERNPGGGPANAAVASAVLGAPSYFIGMAGRDMFGTFLKKTFEDKGVDTAGFRFSENVNTTLAFVQLDQTGNRSFSFYRNPGADMMLREEDVDYKIVDACDILHFSSVNMSKGESRNTNRKVVDHAKANGKLISFDPNLRELLWDSLEEAKQIINEMIEYSDILKISGEEIEFLTGEKDIVKATEILFKKGIPLIFTTLGPDGCYYRHANGSGFKRAYATKVVDTTGSGDAFVGAVLYKLALLEKNLSELSEAELVEMADFANAAGSVAATTKGGIPSMPTVERVNDCRKTVPTL
ncbi:MAG TPA: carbohydrate kinase [Clostridia bacterium]|nr:carbohydrate kinase [Clostridia bacterium]HPQ46172.1 carbohydrate kinase [Clostridia bacterium]HRX41172.1 carbohydrate kinase [Clostridia bacterium]